MREKHKHCEIIKAWADGAEIECFDHLFQIWNQVSNPSWHVDSKYRIKPEPKPDVVLYMVFGISGNSCPKEVYSGFVYSPDDVLLMLPSTYKTGSDNIKCTFDGETGKLKSAEVIS